MSRTQRWTITLLLSVTGIWWVSSSYKATVVSLPSGSLSDERSLTLPGYTGWARPDTTLAGEIRLIQNTESQFQVAARSDWSVQLVCTSCISSNMPWLFVRAYGPSVLTGTVTQEGTFLTIHFHPILPGHYTVEAVVTYSNPVTVDFLPLANGQSPPYYEGYMLRDFPRQLNVIPAPLPFHPQNSPCGVSDLTSLPQDRDLWKRAFWSVDSFNGHKTFKVERSNNVTLRGYQNGRNSLGFTASYTYANGCTLREVSSSTTNCGRQIHIVMVGDSVMRLQRDYLVDHLDPSKYKITFLELYGGYLSCTRKTGPRVKDLLLADLVPSDTLILFNTGMHDIHRLCGNLFAEERPTYLNETERSLSCAEVYRLAVREFVTLIQQVPAAVRIWQTTHAAWPKYGNYGIAWDPRHGQTLPLDAAVCKRFNEIASEEIVARNQEAAPSTIHMVDAYWISLARPDNRETNAKADIGKKLSHPGREVVTFMVRLWWQAAMALMNCPGNT